MTHRMHLPHQLAELKAEFAKRYQAKAARLLSIPDTVYRAFIPERFPLEPSAYLIRRCPQCGVQDPRWARLASNLSESTWASSTFDSLDDAYWDQVDPAAPQRLTCIHCATLFPNDDFPESAEEMVGDKIYPYHPTANGKRYYFTACAEHFRMKALGYRDIFYPLCVAWHCTGNDAYAAKAIALLDIFADRLAHWPYLAYQGNRIDEYCGTGVHVLTADQLGRGYGGWFISWGGSYMITEWTLGYDLISDSRAATPNAFARIRDHVIKPVLEAQGYPIQTYFLDKFHNSTTNHYRAIAGAAHIFGEGLIVEDIVRHSFRLEGGDIAQDLLWGPKGIRQYLQNCFDATGLYAERTSGYQEYAALGILTALSCLRHYSDPAGYTPGPAVAACYRPIENFRIEQDFPAAARPLHALFDFLHSDGAYFILGDSSMQKRHPEQVREIARQCPDRHLLAWEKSLFATDADVDAEPWPPTHNVLSQDFGLAIFRSAHPARPTLSLSWTPHGDYHSHFDSLRITFRAFGQSLFPDLGTNYHSPFRHLWIDRTLAHCTVSVGDERQQESTGGTLLLQHSGSLADIITVADNSVYPELSRYQRTLVNVGGNTPYVVDLFACAGATDYTQSWLGGSDAFASTTLPLTAVTERTQPPYDATSWWDRQAAKLDMHNGHDALAITGNVIAEVAAAAMFTWQIGDLTGQLILGLQQGDTLTVAQCPSDIVAQPPGTSTILLHQRKVAPDRESHFLAAYRLTREATPFTMERRPIPGGTWAKVRHGERTDHIFFRTDVTPLRCKELDLHFDGELLILRYAGDTLTALQGSGGTALRLGDQSWALRQTAIAFTVLAIDIAANTLDIDGAIGPGRRLLHIHHQSGRQSALPALRSELLTDGLTRVWLDPENCKLYTHSGFIGPRSAGQLLSSPTVGPEIIWPGSHIYVADHHLGTIADATCTGDPLRITGMTDNAEPRALQITLSTGTIPTDLRGHECFISHLASGDPGHSPGTFAWSRA